MRPFSYSAPATLDEAAAMLGASARPLAGGTDLITLMKADLVAPQRLVAIRRLLPTGIASEPSGVRLGAATTLAQIERDTLLADRYAALAQAAAYAASPQLRNMATLGGNLLQRPRCWYFRNANVRCWLKGGDVCQARDGENQRHAIFDVSPCVAVHPSDPANALLAFDAQLHVRGRDGERRLPLETFFAPPEETRRTENIAADDDIVLEVFMPAHPAETRSIYLKAMDRGAFSFALVGVAMVLRLSGEGKIGHVRIVLGGVAPTPVRAHAAERVLLGAELNETLVKTAAEAAVDGASPLRHNAWKAPLAQRLVARAINTLSAQIRHASGKR
jgi:xanthine dehydrogenase YagS FAD-binding subunit